MKKKELYSIVLKIIGLFFIRDILLFLPQVLSIFVMPTGSNMYDNKMSTLALTLLALLVYIFTSYLFIFKSDFLIVVLKLETDGQEDVIPLSMHRSSVLAIAIFIIGGLILSQEIPNFFRQAYVYWETRKVSFGEAKPSLSFLILAGVKILIGLLIIGYQNNIVSYIELKRRR